MSRRRRLLAAEWFSDPCCGANELFVGSALGGGAVGQRDRSSEQRRAGRRAAVRETSRRRELRRSIERLLGRQSGRAVTLDRRDHKRYQYRSPVVIAPVEENTGRPQPDQAFVAHCLDISARGFGFVSRRLLPSRRAVVAFQAPDGGQVQICFQPRWVRFTTSGWYHIGCRFLEVLAVNVELPALADRSELRNGGTDDSEDSHVPYEAIALHAPLPY